MEGVGNSRKGSQRRILTEELRELASSVRNGTFHYEGKAKKSLDWSSYDEAQVHELADMLELIKHFVDMASHRIQLKAERKLGRPPYPPADVAKALLLQSYFGVSNRVAAGLVRVFKEKLGISREFSYKTIERGYDPSMVMMMLQEVFKLTNEFGNSKEDTFSIDGSGDPTSMKVNYEAKRSEHRRGEGTMGSWPAVKRHDFQYTAASVGVHTKMVAGFTSTDQHSIGELSLFPLVMAQTHNNCPGMENVLGDTLYATRSACSIVAGYGAKPYFIPKSNSTFRSHGVPAWSSMTLELVMNPQEWLSIYHMRSISETFNSMEKRRFPAKLRKRLAWRKVAEEFIKQVVHNTRQYSYLSYLQPAIIIPLHS